MVSDVADAAVPTPVNVPLNVATLVPLLIVTLGAYVVVAVLIAADDVMLDAACGVVTSSPSVALDFNTEADCADVTSSPNVEDDDSVDGAFGDVRSSPSAADASVDAVAAL